MKFKLLIAVLLLTLPLCGGDKIRTTTVTIADGASLSGATANLDGYQVVQIVVPAANWTAAVISLQCSVDGTTFWNLTDSGAGSSEFATGSLAATYGAPVDPAVTLGCRYVKARSGTVSAATAQAGGDVVTLVLAKIIN